MDQPVASPIQPIPQPSPIPAQSPAPKKPSRFPLTLLGIVLLAVIGFGIFYISIYASLNNSLTKYEHETQHMLPTQPIAVHSPVPTSMTLPSPSPTPRVSLPGKTTLYTNDTFGYTIQYPTGWSSKDVLGTAQTMGFTSPNNQTYTVEAMEYSEYYSAFGETAHQEPAMQSTTINGTPAKTYDNTTQHKTYYYFFPPANANRVFALIYDDSISSQTASSITNSFTLLDK